MCYWDRMQGQEMSDYGYASGVDDLPLFAIARDGDKATSHEAAEDITPRLVGLRAAFVDRLRAIGHPATAQEIAGGDESIRKRSKECVRLGFIVEVGSRKCCVTGKTATCYWVK